MNDGLENADSPSIDGEESVDEGEMTLEARLRRLDGIVATLEDGDIDLERGLSLFEEGIRHIRESERLLAQAELRVEELIGDGKEFVTRPLEKEGN